MTKHVLDVGNCAADFNEIRRMVTQNFDADMRQAHGLADTLELLRQGDIHLVLVNRKLDQDYSDGLQIIKAIKQDSSLADTPCMLVTNFADHQQEAVRVGAEPGFGKSALGDAETRLLLSKYLGD